jgi:hypothetical protein
MSLLARAAAQFRLASGRAASQNVQQTRAMGGAWVAALQQCSNLLLGVPELY